MSSFTLLYFFMLGALSLSHINSVEEFVPFCICKVCVRRNALFTNAWISCIVNVKIKGFIFFTLDQINLIIFFFC